MRNKLLMALLLPLLLPTLGLSQEQNFVETNGEEVYLKIERQIAGISTTKEEMERQIPGIGPFRVIVSRDVKIDGIIIIKAGHEVNCTLLKQENAGRRRGNALSNTIESYLLIMPLTTLYGSSIQLENDTLKLCHDENARELYQSVRLPVGLKSFYDDATKGTIEKGFRINIEVDSTVNLDRYDPGEGLLLRVRDNYFLTDPEAKTYFIPKGTVVEAIILEVSADAARWYATRLTLENDKVIPLTSDTFQIVKRRGDEHIILRKGSFRPVAIGQHIQYEKVPIPIYSIMPPPILGPKLAILIGAKDYTYLNTLDNPHNDVDSMRQVFEQLGFDVWKSHNATKATFDSIEARLNAIGHEAYHLVVFYYSGHGCSFSGTNYLLPVDFQLQKDTFVSVGAVSIDTLTMAISCPQQVIIVDACREIPAAKSSTQVLEIKPFGSFPTPPAPRPAIRRIVVHATQEGSIASDGHPRKLNGLFTGTLLEAIQHYPPPASCLSRGYLMMSWNAYPHTIKALP